MGSVLNVKLTVLLLKILHEMNTYNAPAKVQDSSPSCLAHCTRRVPVANVIDFGLVPATSDRTFDYMLRSYLEGSEAGPRNSSQNWRISARVTILSKPLFRPTSTPSVKASSRRLNLKLGHYRRS